MDNCTEDAAPVLDPSRIAGKITSIVATRREAAVLRGQHGLAEQLDVNLSTIYFASLLLAVTDGTGETRTTSDVLAGLDVAQMVIGDLRDWIRTGCHVV